MEHTALAGVAGTTPRTDETLRELCLGGSMSAQKLEDFLARLYVDDQARARFLADPAREASKAGLTAADCAALENIDVIGLELAAESFARKRASVSPRSTASKPTRWLKRR